MPVRARIPGIIVFAPDSVDNLWPDDITTGAPVISEIELGPADHLSLNDIVTGAPSISAISLRAAAPWSLRRRRLRFP